MFEFTGEENSFSSVSSPSLSKINSPSRLWTTKQMQLHLSGEVVTRRPVLLQNQPMPQGRLKRAWPPLPLRKDHRSSHFLESQQDSPRKRLSGRLPPFRRCPGRGGVQPTGQAVGPPLVALLAWKERKGLPSLGQKKQTLLFLVTGL